MQKRKESMLVVRIDNSPSLHAYVQQETALSTGFALLKLKCIGVKEQPSPGKPRDSREVPLGPGKVTLLLALSPRRASGGTWVVSC